MSKMARSHGKNRSIHQQGRLLSPRTVSAHQRSQHHRPGTSQNRNNLENSMGHHHVRKHGHIEPCECTRRDSPVGDIVTSDDPMEDTDFRLPCEHMHSRNICQESDLYWHSPPGEPHSEPELDSPPQDRHRDYTKKEHTGQGADSYDNCRALEAKISVETGSSVDKDDREQYEREQQELKDLFKDVGEFEKSKSAGWVANDAHEEEYAWAPTKQQPEEEDEEVDNSQYLLESRINHFVGKLPVLRKGNTSRVVTVASATAKAHSKIQKARSRAQNLKLDTRTTCYSVGMDGRTGSGDQQQEVRGNFNDKLAGNDLENLKREEKKEEEETKEVEALSETEEEARELAREDVATKQIYRQLSKRSDLCKRYSSSWNPRISGKGERTTQHLVGDKEEKVHEKPDYGKKEADTRKRSKGMRKKEVMICEESEPLRHNHLGTNEAEHKDGKRTNTRERSREKEEMADKMYEEFKNCYGVSVVHGTGDLELETSKTRTCIDEIIDSGLSREAKWGSGETRTTTKDLLCAGDELETSPLRQGASEAMRIKIRTDGFSSVLRSDEHIRASRGDCFCKTLAEIVTDHQGPQEYMKKLKNCRLAYLNHMQSDLEKLYSLEKYLDSCSLERQPSSAILTTGFSPEPKESKNISDKRDKAKGSGTQSRP